MKQRKKGIIYTSITIAAVLLGSWYWYQKANQPRFCDENMIEVSERQLNKGLKKQLFTKKDFEGLFDSVSDGTYDLFGKFSSCSLPKEAGAYWSYFRAFHFGEYGIYEIASVPIDQYSEEKYSTLLQGQVERNMTLVIDDKFIFWNNGKRYFLLEAKPIWIKKLSKAGIYGDTLNEVVISNVQQLLPSYTIDETNYPFFNRWIEYTSDALILSFNFQDDGTFLADYTNSYTNEQHTSSFRGRYTISESIIKLSINMAEQSAINSSKLPFSWDGATLKLQVDGTWQEFEVVEKNESKQE